MAKMTETVPQAAGIAEMEARLAKLQARRRALDKPITELEAALRAARRSAVIAERKALPLGAHVWTTLNFPPGSRWPLYGSEGVLVHHGRTKASVAFGEKTYTWPYSEFAAKPPGDKNMIAVNREFAAILSELS